jgi:hypothetical protein
MIRAKTDDLGNWSFFASVGTFFYGRFDQTLTQENMQKQEISDYVVPGAGLEKSISPELLL